MDSSSWIRSGRAACEVKCRIVIRIRKAGYSMDASEVSEVSLRNTEQFLVKALQMTSACDTIFRGNLGNTFPWILQNLFLSAVLYLLSGDIQLRPIGLLTYFNLLQS